MSTKVFFLVEREGPIFPKSNRGRGQNRRKPAVPRANPICISCSKSKRHLYRIKFTLGVTQTQCLVLTREGTLQSNNWPNKSELPNLEHRYFFFVESGKSSKDIHCKTLCNWKCGIDVQILGYADPLEPQPLFTLGPVTRCIVRYLRALTSSILITVCPQEKKTYPFK